VTHLHVAEFTDQERRALEIAAQAWMGSTPIARAGAKLAHGCDAGVAVTALRAIAATADPPQVFNGEVAQRQTRIAVDALLTLGDEHPDAGRG